MILWASLSVEEDSVNFNIVGFVVTCRRTVLISFERMVLVSCKLTADSWKTMNKLESKKERSPWRMKTIIIDWCQ